MEYNYGLILKFLGIVLVFVLGTCLWNFYTTGTWFPVIETKSAGIDVTIKQPVKNSVFKFDNIVTGETIEASEGLVNIVGEITGTDTAVEEEIKIVEEQATIVEEKNYEDL